jgi:hypothetical protein
MPARIDEKLDEIIHRRFTSAFMSNAKWRKFFTALDRPELKIEQAIWKFIDATVEIRGPMTKSNALMERYVGDYGLGPFGYKHIEWIEIPNINIPLNYERDPSKHSEQDVCGALEILNKIGNFELLKTERGIRIYGFK